MTQNARVEILLQQGHDQLEREQYQEALISFDKVIEVKADNHQAWYNRGVALFQLGRYQAALDSYDKALEIQPDDHQAWYNRGNALYNLERCEEAIASYNKALEIRPDDYHEAWYNRGMVLKDLGCFEEAIASWDKAVQIKPDKHSAWYNIGLALHILDSYEEAIANFNQVLQLQQEHPEAWYMRGLSLYFLQQYEAALASFDQALQLRQDDPNTWYLRGLALSELQQYEAALASFEQALQLRQDMSDIWRNRGLALSELQQYKAALASFDKALEIKPDCQEAWNNRGSTLMDLELYEEAIVSFDQALEIQPNCYQVWYKRGKALEKFDRYEEAIASYDQALKIKRDFPEAWTNRGSVLDELQRYEEAISSYDQALTIKTNFPEAWKAWWGRGQAAGQSVRCEPLFASFSPIATRNPSLNQRGYEGALASYQEGLKYVHPDTQPEGWGWLHCKIGNAHYFRGSFDSRPFSYWYKAVNSYNEALKALTESEFPELHLEVLQDLIKAMLGLGRQVEAEELQRRGSDLLRRLINGSNHSDSSQKQLALKFVGFNQLTVDLAVQSGQLVQALEVAEEGKNACLTWLLYAWGDEIPKPNWEEIKQLLNLTTAIVYWHLSPAALTTFILKHDAPEPIVITTPTPTNEEELPAQVQHLREFEDWVKDWNQQYIDYRSKAKDIQNRSNHSWRVGIEQRLKTLKSILKIPAIEQELKDITQLILIPHRDLHRFPLHALFTAKSALTITYLPSAQIGINLQQRQPNPTNHLLSIEHPKSQGLTSLQFAQLESEAISQMFDEHKRIQSEYATKNQVEDALSSEYSIFHFTGHGTYNFSNPKKSELALADEDKLTLEEITQKNLSNYNLVTLSACETAITGNQTITTEYVGLVSGFLSQGVAHVVSTLWTVESAATALVMIEFYRRRQAGKSEAVALAEATQWLRHLTVQQLKEWYEAFLTQLPPDELRITAFVETELYRLGRMEPDRKLYDRPYYWAAFTITGKPC